MDHEIVDAAQVGKAILALSGAALAAAGGLWFGSRGRKSAVMTKAALLAAGTALLAPMWWVYNAIEDHFGLDSVAALLINLALFSAVGAAFGFGVRRWWPADGLDLNRHDAKDAKGE